MQVNATEEFEKLKNKVETDGATGMLPFQIVDIVNRFRDAHNQGYQGMFNGLNSFVTLALLNTSDLNSTLSKGEQQWISLKMENETALPRVIIREETEEGTKYEKGISSINGEDPLAFLTRFVTNPALPQSSAAYKSDGSKFNAVLLRNSQSYGSSLLILDGVQSPFGDISKLDECWDIVYQGELKPDRFCFYLVTSQELVQWPTSKFTELANNITEQNLYVQLRQSLDSLYALNTTFSSMFVDPVTLPSNIQTVLPYDSFSKATRASSGETSNPQNDILDQGNLLNFTFSKDATGQVFSAHTYYGNNTMVWKLFSFTNPNSLIPVWNSIVDEGIKSNSTKLLIDISSNGGGSAQAAFTLLAFLYPSVPFYVWANSLNSRISTPINLMLGDIEGNVFGALSVMVSSPNIQQLGDYLDANPKLAEGLYKSLILFNNDRIRQLGNGNKIILQEFIRNSPDVVSSQRIIQTATSLLSDVKDGKPTNSFYIASLYGYLKTLVKEDLVYYNDLAKGLKDQDAIQGGVSQLLSDFFTIVYRQELVSIQSLARYDSPFTSYGLLSDGLAGSAASIFEQNLRSISAVFVARNTTFPRTTAISYGCFGKMKECPLTQFTGGSIGQASALANNLYVSAFLNGQVSLLLNTLIKADPSISSNKYVKRYTEAVAKFERSVPQPPIGMSNFPIYTVPMIYNPLFSSLTYPSEYFKIPPTVYLPVWPKPSTDFATTTPARSNYQESLPELYNAAIDHIR